MASYNTQCALILIDFINDIVHQQGKLVGKGYVDFANRYGTLDRIQKLLEYTRSQEYKVIHVGIGFSPDYKEQPETSPLFGGAKKIGAFKLGEWGGEFHPKASPVSGESRLTKHRVSPFFGTSLDLVLRNYGIKNVLIVGCATDLAVQSAIRDAHDRDYLCTVVSDCCIAANDEDHNDAIRLLSKASKVVTLAELISIESC
jgi:biuret amidohydrolase